MSGEQYVKNIAIVGAAGNIGTHITSSLLQTGRHNITALTRSTSTATFYPGVTVKRIDYAQPKSLTAALYGQDALIITLSGYADIERTEAALVRAAADAGVKWIYPNEWSPDTANSELVRDINFLFQAKLNTRDLIECLGKTRYTAVVTGFWYEYGLAKKENFGFDFSGRRVRFFDEGLARVPVSTGRQVGRAVAALLSLPLESKGGEQPCLKQYRDKAVYTNSFTVSQRDILASACRVTGSKEEDWMVDHVDSTESVGQGHREINERNPSGYSKILYPRVFYCNGDGDFESSKGTINDALGLPKENLDEFTRIAMERQLAGGDGP